jgi:hypothetical protein
VRGFPHAFIRRLTRLGRSLPYDGQGLFSSGELRELRQKAAASFWLRVPRAVRPVAIPVCRVAACVAAAHRALRFSSMVGLERAATRQLILDCVRTGARPNEALVWRQFMPGGGGHPLPGRAAGTLLSRIGSAAEHRLLSDKVATGALLAAEGLPVPEIVAVVRPGERIDRNAAVWCRPAKLFVKPRRGSAARGAFAIEVIGGSRCRSRRGEFSVAELGTALAGAAGGEELLVQELLSSATSLADLSAAGAPPVLRLTTARAPGETGFLHSALVTVDVPGEHPRDFIRGQLRVPIDIETGVMAKGIWFLHPNKRYARLPWNGAAIEGRVMPDFRRAADQVLRAMALVPGLALVNWDIIITESGPVILEGNTCGDWILTNLSMVSGTPTAPLTPILRLWDGFSPAAVARTRDNAIHTGA